MTQKKEKLEIINRTNLGMTQPNFEYVQTMSRAAGMSGTEFLNHLIQQHKKGHEKLYKQAQAFKTMI